MAEKDLDYDEEGLGENYNNLSSDNEIDNEALQEEDYDDAGYVTPESQPLPQMQERRVVKCNNYFSRLPDFYRLDMGYRATNKDKKLKRAQMLGYNTITEAIFDMYYNQNGTFMSIGRELGYHGGGVGVLIRRLGWPTRMAGGSQSSTITMQQAIEIRRDFGTFTNYKKENFVTFYRKKAQEYNSSTEAIRRIIYNTTFYDASYTAMAEKIKKIVKTGMQVNPADRIRIRI